MFFNSWGDVLRTVVVGGLAYVCLIVFVRISGKRTLSTLNAFDFVVTVAIGSILATILLSKEVALAEGLAAFVTLIGAQLLLTWLSVHTSIVPGLVKSRPTLLVFRGELLRDAMAEQRVTESEVMQALRQSGFGSLQAVHALVLETDGSFSAVQTAPPEPPGTLQYVGGMQRRPTSR